MANLIQNYINKPIPSTTQNPVADFSIQHELDNRTFIKPLPGRGRLLDGNVLNSPKYVFDNVVYNTKALKHAIKGQANDHELGKLNDLGLFAGGLSIASYLFTKRQTNMTKGMEFVGLGTFLASMALWPKIAIQLPAYLIHGVNVQKKYEDSFGRTKPFYQDPQFIPWDLYSDKEINKIGNRLGVPKNIPNRRDFIQERMRKLAVQNNTLWMLTAGFATPVMSALMCNMAEPYLLKYFDKQQNKKADDIIANIDKHSKKYQDNATLTEIQNIISQNSEKPITEELKTRIFEVFATDMDSVTSESLKKDLQAILDDGKFTIQPDVPQKLVKNISKILKLNGYSQEFIRAVVPNNEQMANILRDFTGELRPVDFARADKSIIAEIVKLAETFNQKHPDKQGNIRLLKKLLLDSNTKPINSIFSEVRSLTLNSELQNKLKKLAVIFDNFRAKNFALDEYALIKTGSAPETVIANYWNTVSNDFLKAIGISQNELERVRFDQNLMGSLLREKIESIASDPIKYKKVMNSLVESISSINQKIKSSDITSHLLSGIGENTTYERAVDSIFDNFASELKEIGLARTSKALAGDGRNTFGTYKAVQRAFVEERILGVKSSFYRLINTFDFYRRAASNPNSLSSINGQAIAREIKEELIEMCKVITLQGHSSDFATKFYMHRNPHPNLEDYSPIEVEGGKIKNKYFGKAVQTADIPGDKYFYQNAMNFMFSNEMSPETRAILDEFMIGDEIAKYRRLIFEKIGGEHYFWKPYHKVAESNAGSDIKFLLTGISPQELFFKSGQQMFNTKKWLKMFGGFGAGLLGVTVLAQFFLGKIKNPKEVKK